MACCSHVKYPGQVAKRNTSFQYCLTVDYNHRNAITILLKEVGIVPNINLSEFIGSLCSDIIKHIACFFAQVTSGLRIECHLWHRWFVSSAHLCGSMHCFSLDLCASYHVACVPANTPQASQGYSKVADAGGCALCKGRFFWLAACGEGERSLGDTPITCPPDRVPSARGAAPGPRFQKTYLCKGLCLLPEFGVSQTSPLIPSGQLDRPSVAHWRYRRCSPGSRVSSHPQSLRASSSGYRSCQKCALSDPSARSRE